MSPDPAPLDGYPLPAFAFTVRIDGCAGDVDAGFREVSGISAEMQVEPLSEGGENRFVHELPKGVKQGRLSLKRGLIPRSSELAAWCKRTLEGGLGDDPSARISPRTVQVSLLNADHAPVRTWVFENAYPVRWELESLNASDNKVAVERIDLAYQGSTRQEA